MNKEMHLVLVLNTTICSRHALSNVFSQPQSLHSSSVWLNVFNAELSPMRYRCGPRSHKMGKEGDYT